MEEVTIYSKQEISCAHTLELDYDSKCNTIHGHNYIVEVWVKGEPDNRTNMIIDFSKLKEIINLLDHKDLNVQLGTDNPTAELISIHLKQAIELINGDRKVKVRVWEDRDSYAECGSL